MAINDVIQGLGLTVTGIGKGQKVKVPYMVRGSQRNPALVRKAIATHIHHNSVLSGMKIDNIEISEVSHGTTDVGGNIINCIWEGSVSLVTVKKREQKESYLGLQSRSFDTAAGSMNIKWADPNFTQSYAAQRQQGTVDYKGAINVQNNDGKWQVDGIDIIIPTLQFSETWNILASFVTPSFVKYVSSMTGTVNSGGFRGFSPGEVLFLGTSGSFSPLSLEEIEDGKLPYVTVNYNFDTSQNLYNIKVGDVQVAGKQGWDVLSVVHRVEVDTEKGNLAVPVVSQVDVNTVYYKRDFITLGIGY